MRNIGNNLKIQMKRKKISTYELAYKAGLSRYQVENVMYNRSTKHEVLQKLATALNIDLEDLTIEIIEESTLFDSREEIDCEIFIEVFTLINKVSKNSSIKIYSKTLLFKVAERFYCYLKENKDHSSSSNNHKEEVLKGMLIVLQND